MRKFIILFAFLPIYLFAQHDYNSEHNEHSESHSQHAKNHMGMFLGATSGMYEHGETGFTVGLEYERLLNSTSPIMGIGLLFEAVMMEETEFVVGVPIFVHPYKGFKFFVSPNMIFRGEEETAIADNADKHTIKFQSDAEENVIHSTEKFFIRMGMGYDFHFEKFAVSPTISFDLIESNTYLVYGIGFGYSF